MKKMYIEQLQLLIRAIILLTIASISIILISELFPAFSRRLANSNLGNLIVKWSIIMPFLLPLCVGIESWWFLNGNLISGRKVVVDAILIVVCLAFMVLEVIMAFGRYAVL